MAEEETVREVLHPAMPRESRRSSTNTLFDQVYEELRELAARRMARLGPEQTLQPTALVHEVYLRLTGGKQVSWESRIHLLGAAARAMRNVLVDRLRARGREKRGAGRQRVPISRVLLVCEERSIDLLALDDALVRLQAYSKRMSEIVMLRFFVGLTIPETARFLQVSTATIERDWRYAKAWLFREVAAHNSAGHGSCKQSKQ